MNSLEVARTVLEGMKFFAQWLACVCNGHGTRRAPEDRQRSRHLWLVSVILAAAVASAIFLSTCSSSEHVAPRQTPAPSDESSSLAP